MIIFLYAPSQAGEAVLHTFREHERICWVSDIPFCFCLLRFRTQVRQPHYQKERCLTNTQQFPHALSHTLLAKLTVLTWEDISIKAKRKRHVVKWLVVITIIAHIRLKLASLCLWRCFSVANGPSVDGKTVFLFWGISERRIPQLKIGWFPNVTSQSKKGKIMHNPTVAYLQLPSVILRLQ